MVPAFLETDVLLDQPGTVAVRGGGREGQVIKSRADRHKKKLKGTKEEERKRKKSLR